MLNYFKAYVVDYMTRGGFPASGKAAIVDLNGNEVVIRLFCLDLSIIYSPVGCVESCRFV